MGSHLKYYNLVTNYMTITWDGKSYPGLGISEWNKQNESDYIENERVKMSKESENLDINSAKVISGFDPSALERGAKALKEIDNSKNSQDVLRIALETEKTKQKEAT